MWNRGKLLGQGVDAVDNVVQLPDQRVDVFAVKGGDEGAVEPGQGLVGDLVGRMLLLANPLDRPGHVRKVPGKLTKRHSAECDNVAAHRLKQVTKKRCPAVTG